MIKGPTCHLDGITGYGNPEHGIMIVGQNPAYNELKTGLPFTGQDGELLNGVLRDTGWNRDKIYCTNTCCTRDLSRIDDCYPRLLQEIETLKPRLVVTLGAVACSNLFHRSLGDKRNGCRGALQYCQTPSGHNYRGLATWLPSAILQSEDAPELQNDFAAEFVRDIKKNLSLFRP